MKQPAHLPAEHLDRKQPKMTANKQHDIPNTATAVSKAAKQIRPSPPISRSNSFESLVVLGLNSKSIAGIGSAARSSPTSDANSAVGAQTFALATTNEIMPAPTTKKGSTNPSTTHFDPLGTPKCKSKTEDDAALAMSGLSPMPDLTAQMNPTASDQFLPLSHRDMNGTTNPKANHFDPMGTPKCSSQVSENAIEALTNQGVGLFQLPNFAGGDVPMPGMVPMSQPTHQQLQPQIKEEDPFDEIVRQSRV